MVNTSFGRSSALRCLDGQAVFPVPVALFTRPQEPRLILIFFSVQIIPKQNLSVSNGFRKSLPDWEQADSPRSLPS